jgi:uncharacterized protein (DUF934 family)
MALIRDGRVSRDDWVFAQSAADIPGAVKLALPKAGYLVARAMLLERGTPLGLVLAGDDTLGDIAKDLPRFALIALVIGKFTDGRAYSLARALRDRHGYRGELRACGDVLRDQIKFLQRVGFDTLEITDPGTLAALAGNRIVMLRHFYQPGAKTRHETTLPGEGLRRTERTLETSAGPMTAIPPGDGSIPSLGS